MTKLFKTTLALCGAAVLGMALPALAQPGPHGRGGPQGPPGQRMLDRMTQELNLSDAQATQLKAIVTRYHEGAFGDTMKEFHEARTNLEGLISDPASNDQQILTAAKLVSAKGEQLAVQRANLDKQRAGTEAADGPGRTRGGRARGQRACLQGRLRSGH